MLTAVILIATTFLAGCLRAAPAWACVLLPFQPGTILDEEGGMRLMSLGLQEINQSWRRSSHVNVSSQFRQHVWGNIYHDLD